MIAITSKLAYKKLNESGKSTTQKEVIMDVVESYCNMEHYDGKGISNNEIEVLTGYKINAVSGRVNDLKKDGRLKTIDKRKCTINTKSLISPVEPVGKEDVFKNETIDKIKLLLNLYGYKDYEFQTRSNGNTGIMIGYYKNISKDDLIRIQVNSDSKILEHSFYDEDCGHKCWYEIKTK